MKKHLIIIATLLSVYASPSCALPISKIAAMVDTAIQKLANFFGFHHSPKVAEDIAKAAYLIKTESELATEKLFYTSENMLMQNNKFKIENTWSTYYLLNQAALRGSILAKNELDKECKKQPQPKLVHEFCKQIQWFDCLRRHSSKGFSHILGSNNLSTKLLLDMRIKI